MSTSDPDPARRARDEFADTGVSQSASPTAPGEHAGDVIDRYKLLQEIGEGGMGTVWMAEQREPVRRQVALKIVKLGMDTKDVVVRFEAERQALAMMDHPNIAKVLDGGATAQGRPFFVMELVRGVPITQYCDEQRLGIRARLELFTKVCEAIQHAHHKGVIHRDIKPSNVMVTLHDGTPVPKVIDFGIAKATSVELTQKTLFTQYGNMIGTPEYMAPEQAAMSGLDIDTRADVYSLGVLLYELLTGSKPFDITKVLEKGYQELLRTIREDEPAKPSTRVSTMGDKTPLGLRHANVGKLSSRLRGDLDWIVMRALEKDRTRRYETANGFAADVARYLRGEAVHAAPPSSFYKLRKFVARRRKTVASAAIITVLFVAGAVGTGIGWWKAHESNQALVLANGEKDRALLRETRERERAEQAEQAERRRADELELVTAFQASQLRRLDGVQLGVRLREQLLAGVAEEQRAEVVQSLLGIDWTDLAVGNVESQILLPSAAAARAQFADQPVVLAQLLLSVANALCDMARHAPALSILHEVAALEQEHDDVPTEVGLHAKIRLAEALSSRMRFDEALPIATEVLERATRELGECTITGYANYGLGSLHGMRGNSAEAIPYLERAIAVLTEHAGPTSSMTLDARRWLGNSLMALGRSQEALRMQRETLALAERAGPDLALTAMVLRRSLVTMLQAVGQAREGIPLARQALAESVELLGSRSHVWILQASTLAGLLIEVGELDEAEALLEVAMQRAMELELPSSSLVINVRQKIAWLHENRGDEAAVDDFADDAAAFAEQASPEQRVKVLVERGRVLLARGKFDEALAAYQEGVAEAERGFGREHPLTFAAMRGIGEAYSRQGKLGDAERVQVELLELATKAWGESDDKTRDALNNLSITLQRQGKHVEAVALARRAYEASLRFGGERDAFTIVARMNYGICVGNLSRTQGSDMAEAVAELQAAHGLAIEVLGRKHPVVLRCAGVLGETLFSAGRNEALRELADATLADWPQAPAALRSDWLRVRRHRALSRIRLHDREGVRLQRELIAEDLAAGAGQAHDRLAELATTALDNGWAQVALDASTELTALRHEAWNGDWRAGAWRLAEALARGLLGDFDAQEPVVLEALEHVREQARTQQAVPIPVGECMRRVVQFYEAWHQASPDVGADAKAATWRERLAELPR